MSVSFYSPKKWTPRTQKARGIEYLDSIEVFLNEEKLNLNEHVFFRASERFEEGQFIFPLFIRPCPSVPRHGFVDSRRVNTLSELHAVFRETFAEEENAEVGVCPLLLGEVSAILSNGMLTIGQGNDGATSATSSTVSFRTVSDNPTYTEIPERIVGANEAPFWEVVEKKEYVYVVQLRSGPRIAGDVNKDYITNNVVVTRILSAGGDLLEWEKICREAKPGTVVLSKGGSLVSHYAIHAIANNIPVIITRDVAVGEELVPTVTEIPEEEKMILLQKGFERGYCCNLSTLQGVITQLRILLYRAITVYHNISAYMAAGDYEEIGIAAGIYCKITFALCLGEMRHYGNDGYKGSRKDSYRKANKICFANTHELVRAAISKFEFGSWSTAYGGEAWREIAVAGAEVFNGVAEKNVSAVIERLNSAIHLCHNGGWVFNKICSDKLLLDRAARNPTAFAVSAIKELWESEKIIGASKFSGDKMPAPVKLDMITDFEFSSEFDPEFIKYMDKEKELEEVYVAPTPKAVLKFHAIAQAAYKNKVAWEKLFIAQIRVLEGDTYRFQLKGVGGSIFPLIELNIKEDKLVGTGKKALSQHEYEAVAPSLYASSSAEYTPLILTGKVKPYFCFMGKRVLSMEYVYRELNASIKDIVATLVGATK